MYVVGDSSPPPVKPPAPESAFPFRFNLQTALGQPSLGRSRIGYPCAARRVYPMPVPIVSPPPVNPPLGEIG